jgi:hypothetical protein
MSNQSEQSILQEGLNNILNNKREILTIYVKIAIEQNFKDMIPKIPDDFEVFSTKTSGVNNRIINEIDNKTGIRPVLVKIQPLLMRNMCHQNSTIIKNFLGDKYEAITGYNILACDCGEFYTMELHTLLKYETEWIDLTTDMCKETEKWFLPLFKSNFQKIQALLATRNDNWCNTNKEHRCKKRNGLCFSIDGHKTERLDKFIETVMRLRVL